MGKSAHELLEVIKVKQPKVYAILVALINEIGGDSQPQTEGTNDGIEHPVEPPPHS